MTEHSIELIAATVIAGLNVAAIVLAKGNGKKLKKVEKILNGERKAPNPPPPDQTVRPQFLK